jgi:hypothetical protein
LQLRAGVAYFVNIEAEINFRYDGSGINAGKVSYLKSNMTWYISGTEAQTGVNLPPNAVDNSQIKDAGGFLTGAWLANNTLRYQSTGSNYRLFRLFRETKTGNIFPATVCTKYKVRITPASSTTKDDRPVGIIDLGNV